jgi:hypothetical protein
MWNFFPFVVSLISFFFSLLFIYLFFFYYSYVHTRLGSFLPHPLPYHPLRPLPIPPTPSIPSRNYFALISNFVVESIMLRAVSQAQRQALHGPTIYES